MEAKTSHRQSLCVPESDAHDQINYTETHAHRSRNPRGYLTRLQAFHHYPFCRISPPPTGKSAKQPSLHSLALGKLASSSIKHKAAVRVVDRNGGHAPSIQHYHGTVPPSADALTSKLGRVSHQEDKNRKRSTVDRSHFGRGVLRFPGTNRNGNHRDTDVTHLTGLPDLATSGCSNTCYGAAYHLTLSMLARTRIRRPWALRVVLVTWRC